MIKDFHLKKPSLLKEFSKLKTLQKKLNFWSEQLEYEYLNFIKFRSDYYNSDSTPQEIFLFADFEIKPSNAKDILEYNQYILEEIKSGKKISIRQKSDFLTPGKAQEAFQTTLKSVNNKKALIEDEIIKIDGIINKARNNKALKDILFMNAYLNNYLDNQEVNLSSQIYDPIDLLALLKGHEIAEYKKFLHFQREILHDSIKTLKKSQGFTVEQQLLMLHFLGILKELKEFGNDSKLSKFLANMLNRNDQTIREFLGKIYLLTKSKEKATQMNIEANFDIVSEAFQNLGMTEKVKEIGIAKSSINS